MNATKYVVVTALALFSGSSLANAGAVYSMQQSQRYAEQERINSQVQTLPLKFDSFHTIDGSSWTRHYFEIDGVLVSRIVACEKGRFKTVKDRSKSILDGLSHRESVCLDNKNNRYNAYPIDDYMDTRFKGAVTMEGMSLYQGRLLVFYSINQ